MQQDSNLPSERGGFVKHIVRVHPNRTGLHAHNANAKNAQWQYLIAGSVQFFNYV
jgi:hypothetical protein